MSQVCINMLRAQKTCIDTHARVQNSEFIAQGYFSYLFLYLQNCNYLHFIFLLLGSMYLTPDL